MSWRLNSVFVCGKMETLGFVLGGLQLASAITASVFVIIDANPNPRAISNTKSVNYLLLAILANTSLMNCVVAIFLIVGTKQPKQVILEFL